MILTFTFGSPESHALSAVIFAAIWPAVRAARLEPGQPRDWESVRGELGWTTKRFGGAVSRAVSGSAVVHDTGARTLHLSPGQAQR